MSHDRFSHKVENQYRNDSGNAYRRKHEVPNLAGRWIALSRAEKLAPYINEDNIVLEYGVGPGWNLELINCQQRLGYDLDVSLQNQLSSKGIRFISETQAISGASIDTIICHHVLEHTLNPPLILGDIRRMLKDDGRLILIVPFEKKKDGRSFSTHDLDHHLYAWNVQTLGNLVTNLGFSVELADLGRYGWDRFLAVLAHRLKIGSLGFRCLKKLAMILYPLWEIRIVAVKKNTT